MSMLTEYQFSRLRSVEGETEFFARMGYFFASPQVRRECGGYPLSDGPLYRWFIVSRRGEDRVLGFLSLEQRSDLARLRDGYLRAEARGLGLFRSLRSQVLEHIDKEGLPCITRVMAPNAGRWESYGFYLLSARGHWVTLRREANAGNNRSDCAGRDAVSDVGYTAANPAGDGYQPDSQVSA